MIDNYNDINDSELLMMINESNEDAKDIIYKKYNYIMHAIIKNYISICKKLNMEYKELYQEAMLGFADALDKYDESKEASLKTFITLCVERRIHTALVKFSTQKHKIERETLSIDYTGENFETPLREIITDKKQLDPLNSLEQKENIEIIISDIKKSLSDKEKEVFALMLDGLTYQQIAKILDQSPKSIDNAIQRIKKKARQVLAEKEE